MPKSACETPEGFGLASQTIYETTSRKEAPRTRIRKRGCSWFQRTANKRELRSGALLLRQIASRGGRKSVQKGSHFGGGRIFRLEILWGAGIDRHPRG